MYQKKSFHFLLPIALFLELNDSGVKDSPTGVWIQLLWRDFYRLLETLRGSVT